MRSEIEIRELKADLEEAEQSRKDDLAKVARNRGVGGATDETEQEGSRAKQLDGGQWETCEERAEEKYGREQRIPNHT